LEAVVCCDFHGSARRAWSHRGKSLAHTLVRTPSVRAGTEPDRGPQQAICVDGRDLGINGGRDEVRSGSSTVDITDSATDPEETAAL